MWVLIRDQSQGVLVEKRCCTATLALHDSAQDSGIPACLYTCQMMRHFLSTYKFKIPPSSMAYLEEKRTSPPWENRSIT